MRVKRCAVAGKFIQELYNAAGVSRDELPYTEQFEKLWEGFQDRTFKNADREQLFAAIIKYVRTLKTQGNPGGASLGQIGPVPETMVGWIVGIGLLVLVTLWIGAKA